MQDVAVELRTSTSTVSQGIAALARDVGTPLIEPDGRRVRLTPAGHRLAEHAVTIIAAVDAARGDLCLLYTSDAADERTSVDLGGSRIIKKTTCTATGKKRVKVNYQHSTDSSNV